MRAVVLTKFGGIHHLEVQEREVPIVGPNQVLIDVHYAGVNFPDVLISKGLYQFKPELPFSPGGEASGLVAEVGEGVTHVKKGDLVIAAHPYGAFAEKMLVDAINTVALPPGADRVKAAALLETYATGIHAFKDRAALQSGESVAVLGAAGGTGIAAIQIAKKMGAQVIAAASTAEKLTLAERNGADYLINYESEDLKEALKKLGGVDVIYDPVGGRQSEMAFRAIKPGGRHLVIGFTSGDIPTLPWNLPLLKQASVVGVFWGGFWRINPQGNIDNVHQLLSWMAEGAINPQIEEVLPLEDAAEALGRIEDRKVRGKLVLKVS